MGPNAVKSVIQDLFSHRGEENPETLAQPLDGNIPTYTFTCNRCLSSKQALASAKV